MTIDSPIETTETETTDVVDTTESVETTNSTDSTAEPISTSEALKKAMDGLTFGDDTDTNSTVVVDESDEDQTATTDAVEGGKDDGAMGASADVLSAPSRFSKEAKAVWDAADPVMKAEINRAVAELETGLSQKSEALKPVQQFLDMAAQQKVDPAQVIQGYVDIESQLYADPAKGLAMLGQRMGMNVPQMVQLLGGQQAQQTLQAQSDPRDQQIAQLQRELTSMRGEFQTTQQSIQDQQAQAQQNQLQEFAKDHPRMDELADEIVIQVNAGFDLKDAYARAEKLNPLPTVQTEKTATSAQTRTRKSVTGNPANGSNPKLAKPKSTRDALTMAFENISV